MYINMDILIQAHNLDFFRAGKVWAKKDIRICFFGLSNY